MRSVAAAAFALATLAAGAPARANDAAALFDEGVRLLDAGRYAEACPKLEESQRQEPAAGTLLNLAACYEKSDRRVLALSTFRQASVAAAARGRADWQKLADEHIAALDAALPKLTIKRGATPNVRVSLDGVVLAASSLDAALPVEPGAHVVVAQAEARKPYTAPLLVRETMSLTIPLLEPAANDAPPRPEDEPQREPPRPSTIALAIGGLGLAVVAFGVVGVVAASSALSDAKAQCPSYPDRCAPAADAPNARAQTWSTVSTVAFVAGGALVAAGAVLFFWPTKSTRVSVRADGVFGTMAF